MVAAKLGLWVCVRAQISQHHCGVLLGGGGVASADPAAVLAEKL